MTTDLESRVAHALTRQAELAQPRHDLDRVHRDARRRAESGIDPGLAAVRAVAAGGDEAPTPVAADAAPVVDVGARRRRRRLLPVLAAAAAVAGIVGIGVVTSRDGEDGPSWGQPGPTGAPVNTPAVAWVTPHAVLSADSIAIDYAGRTLAPPAEAVATSSMLSRTEQILTLAWSDQDMDVQWELHFKMRDGEWWVEQMTLLQAGRPGSGPLPPEEITPSVELSQDGARSPLGQPVIGDIDVQGGDVPHVARVRIIGMRLLGFRDRGPEGGYVPVEAAPPPVLVAAPPLPADVRPTGMYGSEVEWMTVLVARDELTRQCMAAAGVEYPAIPDEAILRRIDERRNAETSGYHGADEPIINGGAHGIPDSLSDDEKDAYYEAIGAGGTGGCGQAPDAELGTLDDVSPMRAWGALIAMSGQPYEQQVRDQAFADPDVIAVLDAWGRCVYDAVGERAANPEELMRMYAFEHGDPSKGKASDHEKDVAVADVDCRQQVDYETVWDTAVVERERAAMGDRVGEYDQWVRDYQTILARAQQVLADRGIVLPTPG